MSWIKGTILFLLLASTRVSVGLDLDYRWTWISGPSGAAYPNLNLPIPLIYDRPVPRTAACGAFDKIRREYWLFGGNSNPGDVNDLWKYNVDANSWIWIAGTNATNDPGSYSSIGIAVASNIPAARQACAAWFDTNQNEFYIYGGRNFQSSTNSFNDLWMFNVSSNIWTLLSGGSAVNQIGDYSTNKFPGARWGHLALYNEQSREVWIFGGSGYNTAAAAAMNDLWKFSLSNSVWEFLSGSTGSPQCSISSASVCSRHSAHGWMTSTDIWIFGGSTFTSGTSYGSTNDIWKYSIGSNAWVFIAGSYMGDAPVIEPAVSWPTKGVSGTSFPPARTSAGYWYDDILASVQWTWVGGTNIGGHDGYHFTPEVPNPLALPGGRESTMTWYDSTTRRGWMFGGVGYHSANRKGKTNEVWSFDIATSNWTWFPGSDYPSFWGDYGLKGVPRTSSRPANRFRTSTFSDPKSGDLYFFGGINGQDTLDSALWNDLWRFRPSDRTWTWVTGSGTPDHWSVGELGIPSILNSPKSRSGAAVAFDAEARELWLFGGQILDGGGVKLLSDFWRFSFNDSTWTWIAGPNTLNDPGTPGSYPSARAGASLWFDHSNSSIWLFGGQSGSESAFHNDMWRFSTEEQIWYFINVHSATSQTDSVGSYTRNPALISFPGCRAFHASWLDEPRRELWVFGGYGKTFSDLKGDMNDLWKFNLDTLKWSWVSGGPDTGAVPNWGTILVPHPDNNPGARTRAGCSYDPTTGEVWLFGGLNGGTFNDLWRYSITTGTWTWMAGRNSTDAFGIFEQVGVASVTSAPGARYLPAFWVSPANQQVWLFSGAGFSDTSSNTLLGDLWSFSPVCASCVYGVCTGSTNLEATCPTVDCRNLTAGFIDGLNCSTWDSQIPGRCGLLGKCDTVVTSRCPESTAVAIVHCGSSSCQGDCTLGIYVDTLNVTNVCRDTGVCSNEPGTCGIGGVCIPPPPVAAPVAAPTAVPVALFNSGDGSNIGLTIGASVGVVAAVAALGVLLLVILLRRKKKHNGQSGAQYNDIPEDVKHLFSVKYSELDVGDRLGEGSYGVVFRGKYRGQLVAIKKLNTVSSAAIGDFFRESSIMMSVKQHPNVVKLIGMCQEAGNFSLVMEFLENGALSSYLEKHGPMKDPELKNIALGIARGMASLAEQRIVHRDLASRNILLSDDMTPKVSDFGYARMVGEEGVGKTNSSVGPIRWMSPEAIRSKQFSEKSDVWSFGCTVVELITGEQPYGESSDIFDVAVKLRDEPDYHPNIPEGAPDWAKDVMRRCWNQSPDGRPTFADIITILTNSTYVSMPNEQQETMAQKPMMRATVL